MLLASAMEDRVEHVRRRFKSLLASAEAAADKASQEHPVGYVISTSMVSAIKYMNRAGGFLEAVSLVLPELGAELIDEFEAFAAKIEALQATHRDGERRLASARRAPSERRAWERRFGRDRRLHPVLVATDRRQGADRRNEADRRTGELREQADRRLRSVHR
jgi:hypothetical protein